MFGGNSICFYLAIECLVKVLITAKVNNQLPLLALKTIFFFSLHSALLSPGYLIFQIIFPLFCVSLIFFVLLLEFSSIQFSKYLIALKSLLTLDILYPINKCIYCLKSIIIECYLSV